MGEMVVKKLHESGKGLFAGWLANHGSTRVHGDRKWQAGSARDLRLLESLNAHHWLIIIAGSSVKWLNDWSEV
ncbi:hypothetical protein Tco_1186386 [Tanacetum coccineum]